MKLISIFALVGFSLYSCKTQSPTSSDLMSANKRSVKLTCKVPKNDEVSGIEKDLEVSLSTKSFSFSAKDSGSTTKVKGNYLGTTNFGEGTPELMEFDGSELAFISRAGRTSTVLASPGLLDGKKGNVFFYLVFSNNEGEGSTSETIKLNCSSKQ